MLDFNQRYTDLGMTLGDLHVQCVCSRPDAGSTRLLKQEWYKRQRGTRRVVRKRW